MPTDSRQLLLADDEEHSRRILCHYLTSWGYSVIEARDGLEAAAVFGSADAPALALIDWVMPGLDGIQLCEYIRKLTDRPYTYLILLTAKADKEEVAAGLESGADDYVAKPCDLSELRARIKVGERMVNLERTLARQVVTLRETLEHVRQLKELIPICAWCKRVRDDEDYWHSIEEYLHVETGTDFTHGICPHCLETMRAAIPT
jgi:DNA-binding response OmpR family regulator